MNDRVLIQIARCALADPRSAQDRGPCTSIVSAQGTKAVTKYQVPEPWRGNIESTPLLFISSNPSHYPDDDCPRWSATDHDIIHYFRNFPRDFPRNVDRNGRKSSRAVPFWASIRARAAELYDRKATTIVPGEDFALTEVVHCKSTHEHGARAASSECVRRHFASTMHLSPARVVVVLGDVARDALGLSQQSFPEVIPWYGPQRLLVWLPHPNARKKRTFRSVYGPETLAHMNAKLNAATAQVIAQQSFKSGGD